MLDRLSLKIRNFKSLLVRFKITTRPKPPRNLTSLM
jgi:hypothetical protein